MTISELQRLQALTVRDGDRPDSLPQPRGSDRTGTFGTVLSDFVNRVDESQKLADQQTEAFIAGEQENLHEVMIAMNQARLSFQLMVEGRNRMIETYQELMRMQV